MTTTENLTNENSRMETTPETTVVEGDYENPWTYQGSTFTSADINGKFGYVYRITNLATGKQYIGRKYFIQRRKPRGGKRKVSSESDWKKYYGSSPELKQDIAKYGRNLFKREIISLHDTQGKVNFEETRQLFINNVLTEAGSDGEPAYYNSNILGRYYRKDYFTDKQC